MFGGDPDLREGLKGDKTAVYLLIHNNGLFWVQIVTSLDIL